MEGEGSSEEEGGRGAIAAYAERGRCRERSAGEMGVGAEAKGSGRDSEQHGIFGCSLLGSEW